MSVDVKTKKNTKTLMLFYIIYDLSTKFNGIGHGPAKHKLQMALQTEAVVLIMSLKTPDNLRTRFICTVLRRHLI